MDPFEKAVLQSIERENLFKAGERMVVALSGGPDSVALLTVLQRLPYALQLVAAHFNHQLRGEASDADEAFVLRFCEQSDIHLQVTRLDTRRRARESGHNLEDVARSQRYAFLFEVARRQGALVATGHTLNDQAETFLMKLARGAGPAGLSGIYPLRQNLGQPAPVTVVRPLLARTRAEILDYLARRNLSYRIDATNEDVSLERNWVRHQLLPLLCEKLNPELPQVLSRTARLFRETEEFLAAEAEKAFARCAAEKRGELELRTEALQQLPAILQKEVLRLAVRRCKGDLENIALQHIEDVLKLARQPSGKQVHLPGGLRVQHEFAELRFLTKSPPAAFCYELSVPGEIYVKEVGKRVRASRVTAAEPAPGAALLNFPGDRLWVRSRRPGDRYRTSLRSPEKKLKRLLLEKRIPKSRRDELLILEAEGSILWVEGFLPDPSVPESGRSGSAVEIEVVEDN